MFIVAKHPLFLTGVLLYFCRKMSGEKKNVSVQYLKDPTDDCVNTQSFCIGIKFFQLSNKTQS